MKKQAKTKKGGPSTSAKAVAIPSIQVKSFELSMGTKADMPAAKSKVRKKKIVEKKLPTQAPDQNETHATSATLIGKKRKKRPIGVVISKASVASSN